MWGNRWGTTLWGKSSSQDDIVSLAVRGSLQAFELRSLAPAARSKVYELRELVLRATLDVRAELQSLSVAGQCALYNLLTSPLGSATSIYERRRRKIRGAIDIFQRQQQVLPGSIWIVGLPEGQDHGRETAPALSDR
jgi:hypothetical protein